MLSGLMLCSASRATGPRASALAPSRIVLRLYVGSVIGGSVHAMSKVLLIILVISLVVLVTLLLRDSLRTRAVTRWARTDSF